MNELRTLDPRTQTKRYGWLAVLGLALTLSGPFAWVALLHHPWLRSTAAPAWAAMAGGLLVCVCAWRAQRKTWPRIALIASSLFIALFASAYSVLNRLPAPGAAAALTTAPDFTLPDQTGRLVALSHELAEGPVLLVFYRGSW
jgi:hypothetical protein